MRATLGKHLNVKRMFFGDTIYNSKICPAILHGCPTWVLPKSSLSDLKSFQYQSAKAVMNIKVNPARPALLGDLGWKPIEELFEKRLIDYFIYLKYSLNETSLPHRVFKSLCNKYNSGNESYWKYFSNIYDILKDKGLECVIKRDDCDWYQSYLHISKDQNIAKFFKEIDTHNSLSLYKALKNHNLCENYLKNDFDFYGSQLKFLARANVFGLDTNFEKWKKSDGICKHCKNNVKDTLEHRILMCPHFLGERLSFYNNVEIKISSILSSYLISSSNQKKLELILGDEIFLEWGHDIAILFDRYVKTFLVSIFSLPCNNK